MCRVKRTGIITFHCADNYGAMLQAYGLKTYLKINKVEADIIRYEPPFMTGRHWWIPYIPISGIKGILWIGRKRWIQNRKMGKAFFERRFNMKNFREKYLVDKEKKRIFFEFQMRKIPYQNYIIGSDQIWNPDITLGLRKVYFGAFENENKKKVIAYAASLGKEALASTFDREFSELLKYVDVISVREKEAIPYIEGLCEKEVSAMPDPVLLLGERDWERIEKSPEKEGYILLYMTERDETLIEYVKELSYNKHLPVIELKSGTGKTDPDFLPDYTAGPAEFLGYIHKADYVVTNSFHGVAFSIIYGKQFFVFLHSELGARIRNILQIHGLENRLYDNDSNVTIDTVIEWDKVRKCTEDVVKQAEKFLLGEKL